MYHARRHDGLWEEKTLNNDSNMWRDCERWGNHKCKNALITNYIRKIKERF
jgi:hypothetical protein